MTSCIAVNIGNSRISSGIFVDKKLVDLAHYLGSNAAAAAQDIAQSATSMRISQIALCSVVPPTTQTFLNAFQNTDLDVFEVTNSGQKIISGIYDTLGTDRIANLVGALRLHVRTHAAIVIDLGTASTLTAVDSHGKFLGGLITLGLSETLKALSHATEQLPNLDLFEQSGVVSKLAFDTDNAIVTGTVLGHVGLIESWIRMARREIDQKAAVIATGGRAKHLAPHTKLFDHIDPNLTLQGIRLIAEEAMDQADQA